jgi:hypothetical protein
VKVGKLGNKIQKVFMKKSCDPLIFGLLFVGIGMPCRTAAKFLTLFH